MTPLKTPVASVPPLAETSGDNVLPFRAPQSSGNGSGPAFGQRSPSARRRVDPLAVYAGFPEVWRGFLATQFNNDPVEVAHFFRITTKAAEKWLAGIGGPRGDKLFYALSEIDGAHEALFGLAVAA